MEKIQDKVDRMVSIAPRKSYSTLNSPKDQLDFPVSPFAFLYSCHPWSIFVTGLQRDRKHKSFCANYGKDQDDVWSCVKIQKMISYRKEETRTKDEFVSFKVERAYKTVHRISSTDFHVMNPYDVMNLFWILLEYDAQIDEKTLYRAVKAIVRGFLKDYLTEHGRNDYEIGKFTKIAPYALNKFVPTFCQSNEVGTILKTPGYGVIMESKGMQGRVEKVFMRIDELSRYSTSALIEMKEAVENFQGNEDAVRGDVLMKVNWLITIREELPKLEFVFVENK